MYRYHSCLCRLGFLLLFLWLEYFYMRLPLQEKKPIPDVSLEASAFLATSYRRYAPISYPLPKTTLDETIESLLYVIIKCILVNVKDE